jgi:glycosyltransferase involved in cell wall biosynthesis
MSRTHIAETDGPGEKKEEKLPGRSDVAVIPASGPDRTRVMHLITGTNVGGAETMLVNLLSQMDKRRFSNIVYSMLKPGPAADEIRSMGIEVKTLSMSQGHANPLAIFRLTRGIRKWRPDVLQTWMYHANLLGGLAGLICGVPVAWGIHHGNLDRSANHRMTIGVAKICGLMSRWVPGRIVCCAQSSRTIHEKIGYSTSKMTVIPNGFDVAKFRPLPESRRLCADLFAIPSDVHVISLIARFDPQKDHATFIAAAKLCRLSFPDARYVLCGNRIDHANDELMDLIRAAKIEDRVMLLGRREPNEIALIMSRSSVVTSSSWGEAFPMVIGEAMACGTVCVVTDIGDSAYLVGDTGVVVPPRVPEALAAGWIRVLSMGQPARIAAGQAARQRISAKFGLASVAFRYQNLYLELAELGTLT